MTSNNVKTKDKILSVQALKKKIALCRRQGKKVAFTNGCFDLLHVGHVISIIEKLFGILSFCLQLMHSIISNIFLPSLGCDRGTLAYKTIERKASRTVTHRPSNDNCSRSKNSQKSWLKLVRCSQACNHPEYPLFSPNSKLLDLLKRISFIFIWIFFWPSQKVKSSSSNTRFTD